MCESNAYMVDPESREEILILEAVDEVVPDGEGRWRLVSIFGEQKVVAGHIRQMKLVDHRIVFEAGEREPGHAA